MQLFDVNDAINLLAIYYYCFLSSVWYPRDNDTVYGYYYGSNYNLLVLTRPLIMQLFDVNEAIKRLALDTM